MLAFQLVKIVGFLAIVGRLDALTCYRTNEDTHEIEEVEDDDFVFCQYFPAHMNAKTKQMEPAVADGVTIEELGDEPNERLQEQKKFEKFLQYDEPGYRLLNLCLYERYDWAKVWKQKGYPQMFRGTPSVEYQFRCICNFSRCNDPEKLKSYLQTN
uniref:Uncharacterized protein n=1 Tax=Acrobeloides nanus TaxID=290746 RepID=A0A914DR87_9BILA